MFVDASAIVAILTDELDAPALIDRLNEAKSPITSPIALFEAATGLCRIVHATIAEAEEIIAEFLKTANIRVVGISAKETSAALAAFTRYGKGQGHPAQLNLGDCFTYAIAKAYRAPLLYQGEDFSLTDLG